VSAYASVESRTFAGVVGFVITLVIALVIFLLPAPVSFGPIVTVWSLLVGLVSPGFFGLMASILAAYYTYFERTDSQTPGKRATRVKVGAEDGSKCRLPQILVRNFLRITYFLPAFYISGLTSIMPARRRKRSDDILAGAVVVPVVPKTPGGH